MPVRGGSSASSVNGPVTDRGGQVYNVKAYGATGDGVTDDSAYVQAAITAAQAVSGTVLFPPGTYVVSRQGVNSVYSTNHYCLILTGSGVRVSGYGATLKLAGAQDRSTTLLLVGDAVSPVTHLRIEGLTFDGNAANGTGGQVDNQHVIPSQSAGSPTYASDDFNAGIMIRGPYTSYAGYPKVGQQYSEHIAIVDCSFVRWSSAALKAQSYTDNIRILGCLFDGEGIWCNNLDLDGVQNGYVAANTLRNLVVLNGSNSAILVPFNGDTGYRPPSFCTIIGNRIQSIQAGSGIAGPFQHCRIIGNTLDTAVGYGIILGTYDSNTTGYHVGALHNAVTGNVLLNCRFGIDIDGNPSTAANGTGNIIANNQIYNDITLTKSSLDFNTGTNPYTYTTRTWTSCTVAIDIAGGSVVAATRNSIVNNRFEGMASFIYRDNSTGVNAYIGNDIASETILSNSLTIPVTGVYRPVTRRVVTKTADYTAAVVDETIIMNAASHTVTLPSAVSVGADKEFTVANGPSGSSTTVAAVAGTFKGGATLTLTSAYDIARLRSDGANWLVL